MKFRTGFKLKPMGTMGKRWAGRNMTDRLKRVHPPIKNERERTIRNMIDRWKRKMIRPLKRMDDNDGFCFAYIELIHKGFGDVLMDELREKRMLTDMTA